jgi:hypothetical protein
MIETQRSVTVFSLCSPAESVDSHQNNVRIALAYIPFNDLTTHGDALCKFGADHAILRKIARGATALV